MSDHRPSVLAMEVPVSDRRVLALAGVATACLLAWVLADALAVPALAGPVEALAVGTVAGIAAVIGSWAALLRKR